MFKWYHDWKHRKAEEPKATFYTPLDIPPSKVYSKKTVTINGKTKMWINGKRVDPKDPRYKQSMSDFKDDMKDFQDDMKDFAQDMRDMAKDLRDMFK